MTPDLLALYAFHFHLGFSFLFFFGLFLAWRRVADGESLRAIDPLTWWLLGIGMVTTLLTVPFCLLGRALLRA